MRDKEKHSDMLMRLETVIAAVLFFTMLACCGLYIDIKMNGRTSNLPTLSENDTRLLFSSSETQTNVDYDDLLEIAFAGVKNNEDMLAVPLDTIQRRIAFDTLYDALVAVFCGKEEFLYFDSVDEKTACIDGIKNSPQYIIISFYDDLPSDVVLPCISTRLDSRSEMKGFFFKHIFFVPDQEGNLMAYAVSSSMDITCLVPSETIKFNNFFNETYDINDSKIPFVMESGMNVRPMYAVSFEAKTYKVVSYADIYGTGLDVEWVNNLFEAFSLNSNLVKSFTSGDGKEINYIEDNRELVINNNCSVEYKDADKKGVNLDAFLGHLSADAGAYSFSDKVFALKSFINSVLRDRGIVSYSLIGIDYNEDTDSLKFYFKYTVDGIFVFENEFDAVFEIKDNKLIYAYMLMFECTQLDEKTVVLPQKYAGAIAMQRDNGEIYPMLCDDDGDGISKLCWTVLKSASEVKN